METESFAWSLTRHSTYSSAIFTMFLTASCWHSVAHCRLIGTIHLVRFHFHYIPTQHECSLFSFSGFAYMCLFDFLLRKNKLATNKTVDNMMSVPSIAVMRISIPCKQENQAYAMRPPSNKNKDQKFHQIGLVFTLITYPGCSYLF